MLSRAAPSPTDRRPSPLLSNNPFRNRTDAPSPVLPSPTLSLSSAKDRPVSRNPFFDLTEHTTSSTVQTMAPQPIRPHVGDNTTELLENLTISDPSKRRAPAPPYQRPDSGSKLEHLPPKPRHGPSQSEEERRRYVGPSRAARGEPNVFADPPDRPRERRPRRNSDTSVRERSAKFLDPSDDKRRRERRHKRDGHQKAPSRKLDVIDKLDVTSIYGTGLFHHDGPFDACNPHRNRKGTRAAPMQAFPKNSRNMALGGSGPVNSNIDLAQFHGRGEEGYNDYSTSAAVDDHDDSNVKKAGAVRTTSFHPVQRSEPVHGEESMGLGTSTFLEGAPASRTAIHVRESEPEEAPYSNGGGLGRTKSFAMKIKGISNHRAGGGNAIRPGSADKTRSPTSPLATASSAQETRNDPFFKDYDREYEKKGAQISFAESQQGRARAPSSPKKAFPMERRATADSVGDEGKSGGFLSRVRSLKGGPRKPRGDRREAS